MVTDETVLCMMMKHDISSFDSTGENILEDHSSSEEDIKLEGDKDCFQASNESFSDFEVELETTGNEKENQRAQRLIWRDNREFKLETKPKTKREKKQRTSQRRRQKHRAQTKKIQGNKGMNLIETKEVWE